MYTALNLIQKQEAVLGCNKACRNEKYTLHPVTKNHEWDLAQILVFDLQVRSAILRGDIDTHYTGIKHSGKFENFLLLIGLQF